MYIKYIKLILRKFQLKPNTLSFYLRLWRGGHSLEIPSRSYNRLVASASSAPNRAASSKKERPEGVFHIVFYDMMIVMDF